MNNDLINSIPSQQFNGEDCIIIPTRLIRNVSYEIPYDSASVGHITIEVVADWRLR